MDYYSIVSKQINADTPCGANLEDEVEFDSFLQLAKGTEARYDGKNELPAEPPEWRNIKKEAITYLKKTKDIKLVCILAQSVLNTEGIVKFEQCLSGLCDLLQENWENVYPLLDEDDGDAMERISALGLLLDYAFVLKVIRAIPITHSKVLGKITLIDIDRLNDTSRKPLDSDLNEVQVKAIFKDSNSEENTEAFNAVNNCVLHLNKIHGVFVENAGNENSPSFEPLLKLFKQIADVYSKYTDIAIESTVIENQELEVQDINEVEAAVNESRMTNSQSIDNVKLKSREDVEKSIDIICDYFAEYEPSSPIPILLTRAKKLVHLSFIDIVKEIAPDAISQVNKLGGLSDD